MLKTYLIMHLIAIVMTKFLAFIRWKILKKKFGISKKKILLEEKLILWLKLILIPVLPTLTCLCLLFIDDSKLIENL